ncbi:MAG: nitrate reductase molybdenum cofactor assembly chaperone [Fuerstiella sp.]|nr:nitrate reductase molybdenum cofactor assembly chaperone [Fuerstiella sp.]MCP4853270.1 nitrate reductase molybdenum cofactor assembly chaperone [Fuerstiella sp.]
MAGPRTLRSLSRLLIYPDEQTVEAAELLYIILQGELPEAAEKMSRFGAYIEQHRLWQIEETYTSTFDVNPACALDIGWHLFGEEYARGQFLVRMREELKKYKLTESSELPDHITHVLAVIAAMPDDEARRFVTACVLPAVRKMMHAFEENDSPYGDVISCLALILHHVWGEGELLSDGSESEQSENSDIAGEIDRLHAFPVADVGCGSGGCGGGCDSPEPGDLVQLSTNISPERSEQ